MRIAVHQSDLTFGRRRELLRAARALALLGGLVLAFVDSAPATAQAGRTPANPAQPASKLPDRIAPNAKATIERLADSLRQAGIPHEPLYDKAAEGVLKGADDARIVTAVQTLARDLGVASKVLGAGASFSDVVSAASAIGAGVPLPAIQRIISRRPKSTASDERLAMSFIILVDFASRNVPVDAAVNAIDGLLVRGAGPTELREFQRGVERDLQAGRDPRATLTNRAEGVMRRPLPYEQDPDTVR